MERRAQRSQYLTTLAWPSFDGLGNWLTRGASFTRLGHWWPRRLAHPSLGTMLLLEGRPLFNRFIEPAAVDLQHRQSMSKHAFILSESF